ncbi:MAG: hypothetical protein NTX59_12925 [Elusimicrobia bacterium]|nr:hypothetical protein [Elusimicrobiota bacterium]
MSRTRMFFLFLASFAIAGAVTPPAAIARDFGSMNIEEAVPVKDTSGAVLRGYRPEAEVIGNKVYLLYNDEGTIKRAVLDHKLKMVEPPKRLFSATSGGSRVTDIRTAPVKGRLFYAFERVINFEITEKCDTNSLNLGLYAAGKGGSRLLSQGRDVAFGCPLFPMMLHHFNREKVIGTQAVDDPSPIFFNGKYYVLTRFNLADRARVMVFNDAMRKVGEKVLDLKTVFKKRWHLSQNSLVVIKNRVYLIAGISLGPGSRSVIYAIPLTNDLSATAGQAVLLAGRQGEFSTAPKSSRLLNGILFVSYTTDIDQGMVYVEAFDPARNFQSLGRVLVEDQKVGDNHTPIIVLDGKIVAFYETAGRIIATRTIHVGE